MLKKIRLTDFKSFVDEEVELAPLTLLVGANASGKSNFLDAIRFLQGLSLDLTLAEVLNGEERGWPDRWPGIRGRAEEVARFGTTSFTIESTWLAPGAELTSGKRIRLVPAQVPIRHRIVCSAPLALLESEILASGSTGEPIFEAMPDPSGAARLKDHVDPSVPTQLVTNEKSLVSNLTGLAKLSALSSETIDFAAHFHDAFSEVRLLRMEPSEMRGYGRRNTPLGEEGRNFSGVLATLSEDPMLKHSFITWLREVCAPEIQELEFAEVKELGDVIAMFVEKAGTRISVRAISDGTLRFLGTLLALRTARPGEVLLIEEIEEGLHPTRIQFLLELLESTVRQRGIQVIATTHSPVVLQWLAPERLRETLVFGRIQDREGTVVRRLGELRDFEEVLQRLGIEELFTTGWLEMAL